MTETSDLTDEELAALEYHGCSSGTSTAPIVRDAIVRAAAEIRRHRAALAAIVERARASSPGDPAAGGPPPAPGDLRASSGEVVRRADLDRAAGGDWMLCGSSGVELARSALSGDQSALDEFHDRTGLVLPGVVEHCEGGVVRIVWVEGDGDDDGAAFQATSEDAGVGMLIDAAGLVAWILSSEGRAALARRGVSVPASDPGVAVASASRWRDAPPTAEEVAEHSRWWNRDPDGCNHMLHLDVQHGRVVDADEAAASDCVTCLDPADWPGRWAPCLPPVSVSGGGSPGVTEIWRREPPTADDAAGWPWWWNRGPGGIDCVIELDVDGDGRIFEVDGTESDVRFDPANWPGEWMLCLPPHDPSGPPLVAERRSTRRVVSFARSAARSDLGRSPRASDLPRALDELNAAIEKMISAMPKFDGGGAIVDRLAEGTVFLHFAAREACREAGITWTSKLEEKFWPRWMRTPPSEPTDPTTDPQGGDPRDGRA